VRIAADGVPAEIKVVEPTGSEIMVIADIGGQDVTCLFRQRLALTPGEVIRVTFDPASTHIFDAATGTRI
jgi:multiple sugar transport system ATP-binding protein